jgi:hypothetical protein
MTTCQHAASPHSLRNWKAAENNQTDERERLARTNGHAKRGVGYETSAQRMAVCRHERLVSAIDRCLMSRILDDELMVGELVNLTWLMVIDHGIGLDDDPSVLILGNGTTKGKVGLLASSTAGLVPEENVLESI